MATALYSIINLEILLLTSKENINLIGALIANLNNILLLFIFVSRIYKYQKVEYWIGIVFILSIIPLLLMFVKAFEMDRHLLYFIQLSLMIGFIILEFALDYLLGVDFRNNQNIVIPYITLFYASFGGMIGIASQAGKSWAIVTVITFLTMTFLSLFMHFKTGS